MNYIGIDIGSSSSKLDVYKRQPLYKKFTPAILINDINIAKIIQQLFFNRNNFY